MRGALGGASRGGEGGIRWGKVKADEIGLSIVDPALLAPIDTEILWTGSMSNYTKLVILGNGSLDRLIKICILK